MTPPRSPGDETPDALLPEPFIGDAPPQYDNGEAFAWLAGYSACRDKALVALRASGPPGTGHRPPNHNGPAPLGSFGWVPAYEAIRTGADMKQWGAAFSIAYNTPASLRTFFRMAAGGASPAEIVGPASAPAAPEGGKNG